jgi:hypothetical protein
MTSVSSRKVVNLTNAVRQRLDTYTLAAGAAGVTMLALAPPAEAEIIYTPAQQLIAPGEPFALDITGDGTTDFSFSAFLTGTGSGYLGGIFVEPAVAGNAVAAVTKGKFMGDAADLLAKHEIGPKTIFGGSNQNFLQMVGGRITSSTHSRGHCYGPWKNKQNRYLGLKFIISGEVHYGWAELSVTSCFDHDSYLNAELEGYAYETIPNKALKAGQETADLDESLNGAGKPTPRSVPASTPATLGLLAKGAQALNIWRGE